MRRVCALTLSNVHISTVRPLLHSVHARSCSTSSAASLAKWPTNSTAGSLSACAAAPRLASAFHSALPFSMPSDSYCTRSKLGPSKMIVVCSARLRQRRCSIAKSVRRGTSSTAPTFIPSTRRTPLDCGGTSLRALELVVALASATGSLSSCSSEPSRRSTSSALRPLTFRPAARHRSLSSGTVSCPRSSSLHARTTVCRCGREARMIAVAEVERSSRRIWRGSAAGGEAARSGTKSPAQRTVASHHLPRGSLDITPFDSPWLQLQT